MKVFVYGTLRQGESNHPLLAGADFIGQCSTPSCYRLHDLGRFPAVVPGTGSVVGEVYRISTAMMARLDRLEGYPDLYDRERVRTEHGVAWIYVYRQSVTDYPVIRAGDWLRRS